MSAPEMDRPTVLDAVVEQINGQLVATVELPVDQPLQNLPAVVVDDATVEREPQRPRCRCWKKDDYAHGGFSCSEVLEMAARIEFDELPTRDRLVARLRGAEPAGWRVQYERDSNLFDLYGWVVRKIRK